MRKKGMKDFLADCKDVIRRIKTGEKSKISYGFEKIFLWLPGSNLQPDYKDLMKLYGRVLAKSANETEVPTAERIAERQQALAAFGRLLVKIKYEYCFNRLSIFHHQVQLHEVLKRDHDEYDPYDRYFSEGLAIVPWEHHTFHIEGEKLNEENLVECSFLNGIIVQGLFFPSICHIEDLFSVYKDKEAPLALRIHAFVGATLQLVCHADYLELFPEQLSAFYTHYMEEEGERHLFLTIKAYHQAMMTENLIKKMALHLQPYSQGGAITPKSEEEVENMKSALKEVEKHVINCIDAQHVVFKNYLDHVPYNHYERFDMRRMNNWLLPFSFEHPSVKKYGTEYLLTHPEKFRRFYAEVHICDIDQYLNSISSFSAAHEMVKKKNYISPKRLLKDDEVAVNNMIVGLFRFFSFYKAFPNEELQFMNPFQRKGDPIVLSRLLGKVKYIKSLCNTFLEMDRLLYIPDLFKSSSVWEKDEELCDIYMKTLVCIHRDHEPEMEYACTKLLEHNPKHLEAGMELVNYYRCKKDDNDEEAAQRKEKVLSLLKMLEETYPESNEVVDIACDYYYGHGMYEKSLKTLFRGLYYQPEDETHFFNITETFLALGRKEDAWKYAQKMMKLPSLMDSSYVRAGHIALIMGMRQTALKYYIMGFKLCYSDIAKYKHMPDYPRDPEELKECLEGIYNELEILKPYGITRQKLTHIARHVYNALIE